MTDKDRQAFELHYQGMYEPKTRVGNTYAENNAAMLWSGWLAARDHYAPKLTEWEAVAAAATAIIESEATKVKMLRFRAEAYATAALKATGIRLREDA